jgi:hypothetical protein
MNWMVWAQLTSLWMLENHLSQIVTSLAGSKEPMTVQPSKARWKGSESVPPMKTRYTKPMTVQPTRVRWTEPPIV